MKSKSITVVLTYLFWGCSRLLASHFSIPLTTTYLDTAHPSGGWTVSAGGLTDVSPFIYQGDNLAVSSTGNGSGIFLLGDNYANFDGFWTANNAFFLPAAATNIVLTFSNLDFDDAGVLLLNGSVIGSATTGNVNSTGLSGKLVFVDGQASIDWTFEGPNGFVTGTITNGFVAGSTNSLGAIVNNTGVGANGVPEGKEGDNTVFRVYAAVSYDLPDVPALLSIAIYPGVTIYGTPGDTYQIQYATTLPTSVWTPLTNLTLPYSPYLFIDVTAVTVNSQRFYRAVGM